MLLKICLVLTIFAFKIEADTNKISFGSCLGMTGNDYSIL